MHKLGNKNPNLMFKPFLYWNIHSNVSANVKSATLYCEERSLFLGAFNMFGSVQFQFGKQNFN